MHKQGTIRRWDSNKGFGFIQSPQNRDVFFHIRDFRGTAPPVDGMAVEYEEIHVGGKGPRAMHVSPYGGPHATQTPDAARSLARSAPRTPSQPRRSAPRPHGNAPAGERANAGVVMALTAGWLALLAWGVWIRLLPLWWTLGAALTVNLLTFWVYAADKNAATYRRWRVSEKNLHLLGLLGGWPAAWWAQQTMRHKSRKEKFRTSYWATVLLHCMAVATLVLRPDWLKL